MHRSHLCIAVLVAGILVIAAAIFIYAGVYDVAADAPHTRPMFALLDTVRNRSIKVRAAHLAVPADLGLPSRARSGAGLYAEMCQTCHLGPGVEATELAQGLAA